MAMINAFDPGRAEGLGARERAMVERRQRLLGPAYRLFYERPFHAVRGEGAWLFDAEGERYLDCYNNVASLGHAHPVVVEAIARQAGLLNTHTRYLHETVLDYAEALLATFPASLGHVMFTCTGSEANDLALRIARAATGGEGIVVTSLAYHGVTSALAELSPSLGEGVPLGRHVATVAPPDAYRGGPGMPARFAADVAAAFAGLARHGIRPCALLVDTMFTSDGVFPDPPGFLAAAAAAARAAGALFIADEVQPGFGRTGTMWGFERHGVEPDIVTMGKPMGNGHPVAGLAIRPSLLERFGGRVRYFNTFGGNPVSAAAGLAVLRVLREEGLPANAAVVGAQLLAGLRGLAGRHAVIGDVRGAGLSIGVELVRDRSTREPATAETARVVNALRERRVLISASGPGANTLKIRPPLCLSREQADLFLAALDGVLAEA
ncbi:aspartate aminotransferase family protein [Roseomonas nepalensis]|uniref:Aspartate aminotransferase family protein n=1 Tax=Muricoccus nepalensis TaxID=1854500 RepID=A0A502FKE6_9PROT|nr:aspartate aminotransferase family protein [Roseomonas nepalensis]TPG49573.1 aspartate aminotransferase family protein [Roseomonas nepalensis]